MVRQHNQQFNIHVQRHSNSTVRLSIILESLWLKCPCEYYSDSIFVNLLPTHASRERSLPVFVWAGVKFRRTIRSQRESLLENNYLLLSYYSVLRWTCAPEWVLQLVRGCFSFNLAFEAVAQLSKRASNSTKLPSKLGNPAIADVPAFCIDAASNRCGTRLTSPGLNGLGGR